MRVASVPPVTPSRSSRGAFQPAPLHHSGGRRLGLSVLGASLLALALGINLVPQPPSRTQSGPSTLQGGQSFAAGACMACHAIGASARAMAPEPGEAPAFQWIARNHPDYVDGFLLRPSGAHMLVVGKDAAGLRAFFADLARTR